MTTKLPSLQAYQWAATGMKAYERNHFGVAQFVRADDAEHAIKLAVRDALGTPSSRDRAGEATMTPVELRTEHMVHTEESLMALACEFAKQEAVSRSGKSEPGALYAAMDALRLAIREVLKKNQELALNSLSAYSQAEETLERAERAEAECEQLRRNGAKVIGSLCDACLLKLDAMQEKQP